MKEKAMLYKFLFLCLMSVDARSVDKVSDKDVVKRASNAEFFPDWVPFKNKHGEELGEFVQVETKKKPKKRLAHPMNFRLKAVSENDYDDFGGGVGDGGEGEDFEKKEWSDLHRPGTRVNSKELNHTDLSDIDGVVTIINTPIFDNTPEPTVLTTTEKLETTTMLEDDDYLDQSKESESRKREDKEVSKEEKNSKKEKKVSEPKKNSEEDYNYEDEKKQKEKQAQIEMDRKESARRALILKSVDELKLRHQMLSEKEKEDEIFKEEHERDKVDTEEGRDKYERRKPKFHNFYDSYDENVGSTSYDKYDIQTETTTLKPTTTNPPVRKSKKMKKHKKKHKKPKEQIVGYNDVEKFSVFNNPEAFIVKDESEENKAVTISSYSSPNSQINVPRRTTINPIVRKPGKYSSKYTELANASPVVQNREESVRISLVPEASDSDESPTLFFPQTRSKRKKKRGKNDTANTYEAETVSGTKGNYSELTTSDYNVPLNNNTIPDTTGSDTVMIDITSPSGADTEADVTNYHTASDVSAVPNTEVVPDVAGPNVEIVPDVLPAQDVEAAPSEKKEKDEEASRSHKKGGGHEYSASHEEVRGERGKKAYEGRHEETKQAKGHHDKEDHSGEYVDKAGTDKKHHDESNHYGDHHHEEHGKKHAKYEESGKHSKGHSTKGSHDIHKKEEYEKRVEFFEEDGDSSEEEKHGGYHHSREHAAGGNFKKGKLESAQSAHDKGESGNHLRGGHYEGHKGHKLAEGHDQHGRHHAAHFKKAGTQQGKKWGYGYSTPGKVANLITIDRRADQFYNGPHYYG